jgi:polyisoprenoid-binding protein YceI
MRHRLARIAPLLATLALLGCAENAAENKPEAVTGPARPEAPAPAAEAAGAAEPAPPQAPPAPEAPANLVKLPFSDADGSTVKFVGSKIVGESHEGGFKAFQGAMYLDPDKAEVARIEADIDMNSTYADADGLTDHLKKSDFFDVAKFPQSRFVTTEIKAGGKDGASHTVIGNLTLHGVTKSIEFPATLTVSDDQAAVASEFFIKRSDFGITFSPAIIREEVVIKLDVKAPRAKAGG